MNRTSIIVLALTLTILVVVGMIICRHPKTGEFMYLPPEIALPVVPACAIISYDARTLTVGITRQGVISSHGVPLSLDQFRSICDQRIRKFGELFPVFIGADKHASFDHVWSVVRICHDLGISRTGFLVAPERAPQDYWPLGVAQGGALQIPLDIRTNVVIRLTMAACEINGQQVAPAELPILLARAKSYDSRTPVHLTAVNGLRHERVMDVLIACKNAGLDAVTLEIEHAQK